MTKLEEVARAIAEAAEPGAEPLGTLLPKFCALAGISITQQEVDSGFMILARAALTALRTPTDDMVRAAVFKADPAHPHRTGWEAMIDTILGDRP